MTASLDTDMAARLRAPRLYLVTDTALCGDAQGVVSTARAAAENGADVVQLRDHHASTRQLAHLATQLIDVCHPLGVPVVIDDRLDVALAVGADGVHLGQSDLDPRAARRLADACAGTGFHIGWSTSTLDQVHAGQAFDDGVLDLLGIGPFRATPTKPDAAAPLGLDGIAEVATAARELKLSTVAIGGVKEPDIGALIEAGVDGVAVVSAICGQPDPGAATHALRTAVDAALASTPRGHA